MEPFYFKDSKVRFIAILLLLVFVLLYFSGKYSYFAFKDIYFYFFSSEKIENQIQDNYNKELMKNVKLRKFLSGLKKQTFSDAFLFKILKENKIQLNESTKQFTNKGEKITLSIKGSYKDTIMFLFLLETNFRVKWEYIMMQKTGQLIESELIFDLQNKRNKE